MPKLKDGWSFHGKNRNTPTSQFKTLPVSTSFYHFEQMLTFSPEGIESVIGGNFYPDWRGDGGSVWEAIRRTCEPTSPARRLFSSVRSIFSAHPGGAKNDFAFLSRTSSNLDLCSKPHAHYQQGHLFSDWRTIPALYPVFSPAKAKGFMDIRIPSHYYHGGT